MSHQASRRNVYNPSSMHFLRAEWRWGVAAGMWEKIQCVCTDVYTSVCAHWTWGPHSAQFPVAGAAPFSVMAEYESFLVWGCSPHWLPLSPGTSASKEGGEPRPVDVDRAHSCSWSVAAVVLGVIAGPSSHRAPGRRGDHPAHGLTGRTGVREVGVDMVVFGWPRNSKHFSVFVVVTGFCCKEHLITYKTYFELNNFDILLLIF